MNEPTSPVSPSQGGPQSMGPSQPGVAPWLLIVFIVVVLAGGGYLGWYYYSQNKAKTTTPTTAVTTPTVTTTTPSTTTTTPTTSTTSGLNTYTNTTFGFSFQMPKDYIAFVTENFEGGHSLSIQLGQKASASVVNNANIDINIISDTTALADLKKNYSKTNTDITTTDSYKIGGQDGYKFELGGIASGFGYITTNGKLSVKATTYPAADSKTIEQILSTFQFTP
jgi:hypothetical protein